MSSVISSDYDYIVIGGGSAGYVFSLRASKLGKKVALIEKSRMGGGMFKLGLYTH